jgi:hypothetical protein
MCCECVAKGDLALSLVLSSKCVASCVASVLLMCCECVANVLLMCCECVSKGDLGLSLSPVFQIPSQEVFANLRSAQVSKET